MSYCQFQHACDPSTDVLVLSFHAFLFPAHFLFSVHFFPLECANTQTDASETTAEDAPDPLASPNPHPGHQHQHPHVHYDSPRRRRRARTGWKRSTRTPASGFGATGPPQTAIVICWTDRLRTLACRCPSAPNACVLHCSPARHHSRQEPGPAPAHPPAPLLAHPWHAQSLERCQRKLRVLHARLRSFLSSLSSCPPPLRLAPAGGPLRKKPCRQPWRYVMHRHVTVRGEDAQQTTTACGLWLILFASSAPAFAAVRGEEGEADRRARRSTFRPLPVLTSLIRC